MNMLQEPIKVLLVDDEDIIRYGLKVVLLATDEVEIVGEASNGQDAMALAAKLKPDVILMDIGMPVMDGLATTRYIAQTQPQIKILILTTHNDAQNLSSAIQAGAVGYLLKNTPPEEFIMSIRQVHKGYMQLGPGLRQQLCTHLHPAQSGTKLQHIKGITARETDVLELIAEGANNREIAERLHIAEKTVKNHVSSLLSRLGVRDRTQLAILANSPPPLGHQASPLLAG